MEGQVRVAIDCPICGWSMDHDSSPGYQSRQFKSHLDIFHNSRRHGMSIIQKMWLELDKFTAEAIEWSGPSKQAPAPDDLNEWCSYLEDMVDKTEKTAQGRGLAIAIMIACTPFFENSDQVVRLAVKRYQAKKAGENMPDTPGFMGQASGDALHIAAKGHVSTGTASGKTAKDTAKPAVKKSQPPAGPTQNSDTPALDAGMVTAIKGVAASGFGTKQIAATFSVTEEQVEKALAS